MAEIESKDLISQEALQAPLVLKSNFDQLIKSIEGLLTKLDGVEAKVGSAKTVTQVGKATKDLSDAQRELEKITNQISTAEARNTDEYRKKAAELERIKQAQQEQNRNTRLSTQLANAENGSIKQLTASLSQNRAAYEKLSKAERDNVKVGGELLKKIQQQDKELKSLKATTGQFNLEVGNYKNSIIEALGPLRGFIGGNAALSSGMGGLSRGMGGAAQGAGMLGKAMIAIPIFLIIGAITALISYFQRTEEGAGKLRVVMAAVGQVFEVFLDVITQVGEYLANLSIDKLKDDVAGLGDAIKNYLIGRFEILMKGINGVGKAFSLLFKGEFKEAANAAGEALWDITRAVTPLGMVVDAIIENAEQIKGAFESAAESVRKAMALQERENKLIKDRRSFLTASVKIEGDIAEARERSVDALLSNEERLAAIVTAEEEIMKLTTAKENLLKRELAIIKERAALSKTDETTLQRIAELEAETLRVQVSRREEGRRLVAQRTGLEKKIAEEALAREIGAIQAGLQERKNAVAEEIADIKRAVAAGTMLREEGEKKIIEIKKAARTQLIEAEMETIEGILAIEGLSDQQRADNAQKLFDLRVALADALYDHIEGVTEDIEGVERESIENIAALYVDLQTTMLNLFDSLTARRLQNIDREIKALEAQTAKEIELAGNNEAAKAAIEAQGEQRRAELERKRVAEQRKAAVREKVGAIFEAGIRTALAVLNQLATAPGLTAIPRAVAAGAAGAAQIAAIAAKPIPQFKDGGTTATPLIIAGEEGVEMYRTPGGDVGLTPAGASLMRLPIGTEITPHAETMQILAQKQIAGMRDYTPARAIISDLKEVKKATVEGSRRIERAVRESKQNLFRQGSLVYEAKQQENGNKKMIRLTNLSR